KPHDGIGFIPAKSVSDHTIANNMKEFFNKLPQVENIIYSGEYPISFLTFEDEALPIETRLIAFNPFIPLDSKNSGIPVIIFQIHIKNISDAQIEATVLGNLMNFLGWDGKKTIRNESSPLFSGNYNVQKNLKSWKAIYMRSKTLLKTDKRYGNLTFAIDQHDAMVSSQWENLENFWSTFSDTGVLFENKSGVISEYEKTWTGSLATKIILNPGEKKVINFCLTWNFPNRKVDWHINTSLIREDKTEYWMGNRYNEWFKNSFETLKYVQNNWEMLLDYTNKFHEDFYSSTLPSEVLTSISATLSTIRTPTCFWIRDGTFHGFEGCHGASTGKSSGGCCPLNCTHVWNYEFSLAHLFPSLERTMRETEFKMQHKLGYLPHRTVIPLYLPQFGEIPDIGDVPPAIDGMFGMILKIYRDFLITNDRDFLKRSWVYIEKLMDFIFKEYENESDGMITRAQPNTYDCSIYGLNTFISSLNLIALLACEQIALELDIKNWAKICREKYNFMREVIDKECWNGEYYIQKYDISEIKKFQYGTGCLSDQLIGQWWAFHLGFGYIFPKTHVQQAIKSIVKYNYKETLNGFKQTPRIFASNYDSGLLVCSWPNGGKPEVPTYYTDEVWTGIEYEVAALCFYTGVIESGLKIIKAVRDRYDGTHRNPWNEVECGDHYVRPMSSWTLLHALTGISYSSKLNQLSVSTKINQRDFQSFFITNSAWGKISQKITQKTLTCSITISYGTLELSSIAIDLKDIFHEGKISKSTVISKGKYRDIRVTQIFKGSIIEISLDENLILDEGHQLLLEFD
ncbi:MAG: GH116 family glycosyl hydrolase, partial [Promethearchaeota archaeon]